MAPRLTHLVVEKVPAERSEVALRHATDSLDWEWQTAESIVSDQISAKDQRCCSSGRRARTADASPLAANVYGERWRRLPMRGATHPAEEYLGAREDLLGYPFGREGSSHQRVSWSSSQRESSQIYFSGGKIS